MTRSGCCANENKKIGACTIPKGIDHEFHECWSDWGWWSSYHPVGTTMVGQWPVEFDPNKSSRETGPGIAAMKLPSPVGYNYDEYDLLPDVTKADIENGLPSWEDMNRKERMKP